MTEFVTISLESNQCDICEQETREELVFCVVNDRCLRQGCDWNYKRAHPECLEKWESVMRNSMKPLGEQSKRTWKDRIKEFVNSNSGKYEERLIETLAPSQRTELISESLKTTTMTNCSETGQLLRSKNTNKCDFLVDETYSIERISDARKVRVRSLDMESVGDTECQEESLPTQCLVREDSDRNTVKQLERLTIQELRDAVTSYKLQVTEASYGLVNELQQRDGILQQGETMRVTIAQLVSLQQQMRANSPQKAKLGTRTQSLANTMHACI